MSRLFHTLCAVLLALTLGMDLVLEFAPGVEMGAQPKLLFAAAFALLWTLTCLPMCDARARRRWLTVLFLYYLWLLLNVLFFDAAFGRSGLRPQYAPGKLWQMLRDGAVAESVSMIPLRTIRNYLSAYGYGNISRELLVLNLGGNLAAFAPMGFFLPALYRWQRNPVCYALTMGAAIAAVELVQGMTGCGSVDIDDFILNFVGAVVVWLLCWFPTRSLHRSMRTQ